MNLGRLVSTNLTRCSLCGQCKVFSRGVNPSVHFSRNSNTVLAMKQGLCISYRALVTSNSLNFRDIKDKAISEAQQRQLIKQEGEYFDKVALKAKNREAFQEAVMRYKLRQGVHHRGHVEFIYAAMDKMEMFNVHQDLEVYKTLMEIFPKEKMIPRTSWQVEFMHYPKQQNCMIDIMEKMEHNGVMPDDETGHIIAQVFGKKVHAFRKYQRLMYWMPKFRNANPYPVPRPLPEDPAVLAVIALQRMAVDVENTVDVHKDGKVGVQHTFIASAQSPVQMELITQHNQDKPLFVEGCFNVWLRDKCLNYFILKADPQLERYGRVKKKSEQDENWLDFNMFESEKRDAEVIEAPSVHEQEEGTILALCITGTSTKDSLISWIQILQQTNPNLIHTPVVFSLRTPENEVQIYDDHDDDESELIMK